MAASSIMDDTHEVEEKEARQALADSMMKSVNTSKLRSGDTPTIYIVPQRIRQVNEVAYEPQMVSIGPYHSGKERLKGMEKHKWRYLDSILSRNPNHDLEDYLEAIKKLEDQARSFYYDNQGPPTIDEGKEFVKMMVLDGCFIVELFLKLKEKLYVVDPIFSVIWMLPLIGYDMLLLENQIPFFILQCIFEMVSPENKPYPYLLPELALDFFDQFMPRNKEIQIKNHYLHLLHLFHSSHLITTPTHNTVESVQNKETTTNLLCNPTIESVLKKLKNIFMFFPSSIKLQLPISNINPSPVSTKMIPCAAELKLAGVTFKKKEDWNSVLEVKFSNGVLEIPPLSIQDHRDSLFRNLIAFEQCHPEAATIFTTYLVFMDYLVNTSNDVALLHQVGIIDNLLGSDDDLAHLFNRLCIGICHSFDGSYLSDLKDNVQKHCENKWNMWRASLKRDYFTKPPGSVIGFIVASILPVLTITQTFYTVFAYYRRGS